MISAILSRLVILLFGTLYPAYASYKAVRTKNVKEYVKWMMYWIVFALFTCAETFTDVFLSFWFPFYYEIKIVLVIWLLSPATKGSSILYRNFVHPALTRREQEIDEYISKAKEQGYHTMLHLGSRGVTYATSVIMQTAIKGGGGIVNHLRRSYSLSDLSDETDLKADLNRNSKLQGDTIDAADVARDPRLRTSSRKPGGSHVDLYFPEMDVDIRSHSHHPHELPVSLSQIRSTEDISSGYSSAEPLYREGQPLTEGNPLMRTASVGATRARARGGRSTTQARKPLTTEEEEDDFKADLGWQRALPPIPITSLFPELLNLDPSVLPPQAFLSPEALALIYSSSIYRGQASPEVCEIKEEKNTKEVIADIFKVDDCFMNIGEEKTLNKITLVTEPIENGGSLNDESRKEKINLNSEITLLNEMAHKKEISFETLEEGYIPVKNVEITEKKNLEELSVVGVEQNKNSKEDIEQNNECFEDASDAEIAPAIVINRQVLSPPAENYIDQTKNVNLKPTGSMESIASSGDQCFEDSLPEVAIVSRSESPNSNYRKGKYNKGRAPPPPDDQKREEPETIFGDITQSSPSDNFSTGPDVPTASLENKQLKSELSPNLFSMIPEHNINDKGNQSMTPTFDKRDVSPSPSQSKKDNTNLSRFLPKAGMTSLFNFWGPKDDLPGSNKSIASVRRSPSDLSNKSQAMGMSNSLHSDSNIEYSPDSGGNVENVNKTTPKLKLRQMSQSPSRRRRYNY